MTNIYRDLAVDVRGRLNSPGMSDNILIHY